MKGQSFWFKIFIFGFVFVLSVAANVTESLTDTLSRNASLPVELEEIGYDGTWEQFCDPQEIEKDYLDYPKDELRKLRLIICQLKEENKINRKAMPALAVYKYCLVTRPRVDEFLFELTKRFTHDDSEKRKELLANSPTKNDTSTICYEKSIFKFSKTCIEEKNPYFRIFKPLIARACEMPWLSAEDIKENIEKVCVNRLITASVDWQPIFESVNYRGE